MNATAPDPRDTDLKKDLDATVRARRDLGDEYESALVESFLEKVDRRIDEAVDRRVRRQLAERRMEDARDVRRARDTDSWAERFGLSVVSLLLAIPLSAIAASLAGLPGLITAWVGIVGVNMAQAARLNPDLFAGRRGAKG
ncbi:hypothetical protein KUM39_17205 [Streptomyces sp. J2-1]|uniref:hypothetical protein n=1 Tax=Streptomyces corallincola TaxID=2851888 RepID=UPI001C38D7BA|nr:hypothetical protein [Streptomyces corallincola]MBV2356089.1 hypothetical protein [Streptomyces corallincola]